MTPWLHWLACFFGAAFLTNALPHFISGLMGRPFQTPFAKPPGEGLSSATVNVLWALFNLIVAWLLLQRVAHINLSAGADLVTAGLGLSLTALLTARHFGRFNGGNTPTGQ
jgi:hypothetical protein